MQRLWHRAQVILFQNLHMQHFQAGVKDILNEDPRNLGDVLWKALAWKFEDYRCECKWNYGMTDPLYITYRQLRGMGGAQCYDVRAIAG